METTDSPETKAPKRHNVLAQKVAESCKRVKHSAEPSRVCGHCNQKLCLKVFKKHERLYRRSDKSWIPKENVEHQSTSSRGTGHESEVAPSLPVFLPFRDNLESSFDTADLPPVDYCSSSDGSTDDELVSSDCSDQESSGEEFWDEESDNESDDEILMVKPSPSAPVPPEFPPSKDYVNAQLLLKWIAGFLFILQAKYHIPNAGIDFLIKFLFLLICVLGQFSPFIRHLQQSFPRSLNAMRKKFLSATSFAKYPVCPKCSRVYESLESCIEQVGSNLTSKQCSYIQFPRHPQESKRRACQALLLKSVQFKSGKTILYPFKVYCYNTLKSSLQKLLMRPAFLSNCELWRSRPTSSRLSDIYDGNIWKKFLNVAGSSFLAAPLAFGLMLNIDWFQPYSHTVSSVGVIYLVVMNLPRTLRYKPENLIIIGIIPGPTEPRHDLNSYLDPLVEELLKFWSGLKLRICSSTGVVREEVIKCALLCVSCDLPAARKVCGFLSFSAKLGCSKCLKVFPGKVGERDYSGFDRSQWEPRTDAKHRSDVEKLKECRSKSSLTKKESKFGCRYSSLLDLHYFSPTHFLVIDPMHNLFLGTGKRILGLWIQQNLLGNREFERIQHFVDNVVVPPDVGRIPTKIGSGFSGFKADQFKTWITLYSIPALFGILPDDHYECWRHFVLACRILCKQSLSQVDISLADGLLLQFCTRVERLYGKTAITPNMHLHGHLKDVILDYGPIQEFWCYSFERFNGILGNQPTNNRAIEPQLLKQFLLDSDSTSYVFPEEFAEDFASLDLNNIQRSTLRGSVLETITKNEFLLPTKFKRCVFSLDDLEQLTKLYKLLNPAHSKISIDRIYKRYPSITLRGKVYRSSGLRNQFPCVVLVSWNEAYYGPPPTTLSDSTFHPDVNNRPVNVHYYITATCWYTSPGVPHEECRNEWTLAYVSWLFPHPKRYCIGKPAELWCDNLSESFGIHSFVTPNLFLCRCAHGPFTIDDESLLVVVPLSV